MSRDGRAVDEVVIADVEGEPLHAVEAHRGHPDRVRAMRRARVAKTPRLCRSAAEHLRLPALRAIEPEQDPDTLETGGSSSASRYSSPSSWPSRPRRGSLTEARPPSPCKESGRTPMGRSRRGPRVALSTVTPDLQASRRTARERGDGRGLSCFGLLPWTPPGALGSSLSSRLRHPLGDRSVRAHQGRRPPR